MRTDIDIAALRWTPRPKGNGTEASNIAEMYEHLADDLLGESGCTPYWTHFAEIDSERMALRCDEDGKSVVLIVTVDWDGAPDGRNVATRVDIHRLGEASC